MKCISNEIFEENSLLYSFVRDLLIGKSKDFTTNRNNFKKLIYILPPEEIVLLYKASEFDELPPEDLKKLNPILSKLKILYNTIFENKYKNFREAFVYLYEGKNLATQAEIINKIVSNCGYDPLSTKVFKLHFLEDLEICEICRVLKEETNGELIVSKEKITSIIKNIVNNASRSTGHIKQDKKAEKTVEKSESIIKDSFYRLFRGYTMAEICKVVDNLSIENQALIYKIYDFNLEKTPKTSNYTQEEYIRFVRVIAPLVRRKLKENCENRRREYEARLIDKKI